MLSLGSRLSSFVVHTARLARDVWQKINDVWELEARKWENIT